MAISFLGMCRINDSSEVRGYARDFFDKQYVLRLVGAYEEWGFDYTLTKYAAGSPDPGQIAAWLLSRLTTIKVFLAHRPNVSFPTYAAAQFASLDQISGGRLAAVHFITGGDEKEQRREGDTLPKARRYARTREYIEIVRRAWAEPEAFSHHGEFYQFDDFRCEIEPSQRPGPKVSFGGVSTAALEVGAAVADIYGLFGEPVAEVAGQIGKIDSLASASGRSDRPEKMLVLRPILAPTDAAAWAKAEQIGQQVAAAGSARRADASYRFATAAKEPEAEGYRRLVRYQGQRFDRAGLSFGNSLNIVGSPDTVAAAMLDYYDAGVSIFHVRGYDTLPDAIDFGRHVIPLVREGVASRPPATNTMAPGAGINAD